MKPTFEVKEQMTQNENLFTEPFFKRFELRHAPKPIQLNETVSKNYFFPTLYKNVTCAIGIFFCNYEKAKSILPDPRMNPINMLGGRSLVVFSCYNYGNVMNVAPYNEIAMSIPVMMDSSFNPPILPMILNVFSGFGFYAFGMPVTSKENQLRGNKIWGIPKVTQEIDQEIKNGFCTTTAKEEDGTPYLELSIPTSGKATQFDVGANLFSKLGNKLFASQTCFSGQFNVVKNMGSLIKKNQKPDRTYIKLGNTPSAKLLRNLEIDENPFQLRFSDNMVSAFDLPKKEWNS